MIWDVHTGSGFFSIPDSGSGPRIQMVKKHQILYPDPQHCTQNCGKILGTRQKLQNLQTLKLLLDLLFRLTNTFTVYYKGFSRSGLRIRIVQYNIRTRVHHIHIKSLVPVLCSECLIFTGKYFKLSLILYH
jgi:hypothetical protein